MPKEGRPFSPIAAGDAWEAKICAQICLLDGRDVTTHRAIWRELLARTHSRNHSGSGVLNLNWSLEPVMLNWAHSRVATDPLSTDEKPGGPGERFPQWGMPS